MGLSDCLFVVARLWWLGIWESLQLQRCVVLVVLDKSSLLKPKILQCLTLNGLIFLGSMVSWDTFLKPAIHHAAVTYFQPAWGTWWAAKLEGLLELTFNVLWTVPAYLVTLLVSGTWYQELAVLAVRIQSEKALLDQAKQQYQIHGGGVKLGPPSAQGLSTSQPACPTSPPPMDALENMAQELSRSVLFVIFYVEVWALGMIPYAGQALRFLMLSWLYAFFCFDYSWSSSGVPLHERLAYVEAYWPYYAGYGTIMSGTTVLLPFYSGAALLAALFPFFTLIACDASPLTEIKRVACGKRAQTYQARVGPKGPSPEILGPAGTRPISTGQYTDRMLSPELPSLQIFFLPWWLTELFIGVLLGVHASDRRYPKS